jgi:hypothetical protein
MVRPSTIKEMMKTVPSGPSHIEQEDETTAEQDHFDPIDV